MSDAVKWGILAGVMVVMAGIIFVAPYGIAFLVNNLSGAGAYVNQFISVMSDAFYTARGLINIFFPPAIFSALLLVSLTMFIVFINIKFASWIAHFIYK